VAERCKDFGFTLESRDPIGIIRKTVRQNFDRDIAFEFQVTRAIDLTHPAFTKQGCDFVRAELLANLKGHQLDVILWKRTQPCNEV
jgi:hypothetical protein